MVRLRKLKVYVSLLLAAALFLPQAWIAPVAEAAVGDIVMSADFDTAGDTNGWVSRGTTVVEQTYGTWQGSSESGGSLYAEGRTANWHGPSIVLTNVQKGATYEFSLYAKMADHDAPLKMTVQQDGLPATGENSSNPETFKTVAQASGTTSDWVHLTGQLTLNPEASSYLLYVEAEDVAVDNATVQPSYYIDTFTLKLVEEGPDQSGITEGFEEGVGDWVRRFAAEPNDGIEVTADEKHSGEQSLKTTVAAQYDGPLLSVVGKMHQNHRYRLSAWVKMAEGEPSARLRITVQNGSDGYTNIGQTVSVNDQQWVQLTGEYTQSVTPGEILNAYVEIADALSGTTRTFLVDDFKLEYVGPVAPPQPIQEDIPQLQEHFKDDFLLGNAVSSQDLVGERLKLLKRHHNVVTAENAMKPEQLYNASKAFTPAGTDALVQRILDEELLLVGHTLVWHAQSPTWLNTAEDGTPLSREEALANLEMHITQVVEHYGNLAGDKLISWDVVNEAMSDNPPNPADWKASLRNSPWKAAIGDDYVEQAFRITREVLEANGWDDVVLYYNDYNDENPNKSTAIYNMIKEINEKFAAEEGNEGKLLIEGMGLQSHYNTNTSFSLIETALAKYISLGVEISITELDIMAGSNNVQTEAEVKAQAYLYAQLFKLYRDNAEHIARVTFWGLNDGNSWRRENSPLIFDRQLQAKPGYYAILDPEKYMEENPPVVIEAKQAEAKYGTPTVDGTVDSVWSNAAELDVNHYLQAWQGATGKAKALWDDHNLYVLVEVTDAQLDKGSANPWEQDSIEIFLDQNNAKTSAYEADDGQYRVNYENTTTFNPASIAEGFASATSVSGTNYTVEVKIPLNKVTPANDVKLGFDVQVNDGKDGARQSTATWSATNGNGYQDTSVFGVLTLKGKQPSNPGTSNPGSVYVPIVPTTPTDGPVKLDVPTQAVNGRAVAAVSDAKLSDALAKAKANEDGTKEIVVELQKLSGTNGYGVQFGSAALKRNEKYIISVKSELGMIQLPSNMLIGTDLTGDVLLTIGAADLTGVSEEIRSQIGDRPVIELQMQAGGKAFGWNNPSAPVTVSVPYQPTAAELANPSSIVVWYVDGNGNASAVPNGRYDAAAGAVVFKTTHFSVYAVVSVPQTFDDIGSLTWAKDAIEALASREVVKGVSETAYQPSADVKRADFLVLLVRALGLQAEGKATFADVAETAYYYEAVSAAEALGITKGDGKGNFNPNAAITRQEMFVLTARALEAAGQAVEAGGTLAGYSDAATIAAYAQDSTALLAAAGIVKGIDGEIQPDGIVTRAQAAVIVYRALGLDQ